MTPFGTPFTKSLSAPPEAVARLHKAADRSSAPATPRGTTAAGRVLSVADRAAAAVRQQNARDCLLLLRDAGEPLTVGDLARRSGLSRPTVDAVLQDLIAAGSVRAADASEVGSRGRPARRFVADPSTTLVAGVELGARGIQCALTDAAGRIVTRTRTRRVPGASSDPLGPLVDAVTDAMTAATAGRSGVRLAAVGLAVPGSVDHDHRPTGSAIRPESTGADLGTELSQRLGCTVVVENDLKLAAYAEHHIGRAAGNMIFVRLGRRISVALMIGGRILQGSHRMAGDICAQRGMQWTNSYDEGGLRWSTGREARPIFERAASGDQQAVAEIDEFCAQLATRLATMVLTLDPEVVVVGGGLSLAGDGLLRPLRRHLDQLLTSPCRPELLPARLVTEGAVAGALGYAFDQASEQILGIPAVPPPWCRLRAEMQAEIQAETQTEIHAGVQTDPGCPAEDQARNDRESTEE